MYISHTRFAFSLIFLCGFYFHSCRSDGSPVQIHKWRPITSTFTNIWTCIKKNYFLHSCSLCIVFMLFLYRFFSLLPVVVVVVVVALASFFECASVNVDHETKKIFSMWKLVPNTNSRITFALFSMNFPERKASLDSRLIRLRSNNDFRNCVNLLSTRIIFCHFSLASFLEIKIIIFFYHAHQYRTHLSHTVKFELTSERKKIYCLCIGLSLSHVLWWHFSSTSTLEMSFSLIWT